MQKTGYYSWKQGTLPKGCRLCVEGRKLVLFVTGVCSKNCWYCPLSEQKKNKDIVFANEWKTPKPSEIIREAELCNAKGAGITGGDPLLRIERTASCIRLLKKRFGKKFHIHLYAPLTNITEKKLKVLYNAGLDEIRLHPDFYSSKSWERIRTVNAFDWDVGVEIPAIPALGNETMNLIDYFLPYIKFLNINELEQSDTNMDEMVKRGLRTRNSLDYSIRGSHELAMKLLRKYSRSGVDIHYCTTRLKDAVQLAARIKIRAKNIKEKFDKVTEEGMLVRGAVYLNELKPGFGYRKILERMSGARRRKVVAKLRKLMQMLKGNYRIKPGMIKIDERKPRILTSAAIAAKIMEKGISPAIVTEYPTWDQAEIEIDFI